VPPSSSLKSGEGRHEAYAWLTGEAPRTFCVPLAIVPQLHDPTSKKNSREARLAVKCRQERDYDVHYGTEDSWETLGCLLYFAVGPVSAHLGKELGIPQAKIGTPSCKGIQGDKKSGPSLAQADLVQLRLTLLNVRSESRENLTNVFRLFLQFAINIATARIKDDN
jgi:hypothetical protein